MSLASQLHPRPGGGGAGQLRMGFSQGISPHPSLMKNRGVVVVKWLVGLYSAVRAPWARPR